jgi:hypothetical protein
MYVRGGQRVFEQRLILIGEESKQVLEPALRNRIGEFIEQVPAPHEHEHDASLGAQALRRIQDGFELVGAAEISRISDDELVCEPPLPSQWIVRVRDGRNLIIIAPIMDDVDAVGGHAAGEDALSHAMSHDHVGRGCFQRSVAQVGEALAQRTSKQRNAQLNRDFRVEVLQPVHEMRTAPPGSSHRQNREQGRIRLRDDDIAAIGEREHAAP